MAEFKCQCGNVLENGRHGDMLYVFRESEILAACQQAQGITLREFLINWRRWALRDNPNVVYWGCPECGRVYEAAPAADGEVYRTFERVDRQDEVDLTALATFDRVFILTADLVAEVEERVGSQSLFDLIYTTRWPRDYFLHPEEKMLLALEATTNMSAFVYEDVDKRG
ncbi:MAG: hypothetical protein IKX83_06275 [Clostridia bacterium]|nr:hypothetical protein [Clostridia bacterium]